MSEETKTTTEEKSDIGTDAWKERMAVTAAKSMIDDFLGLALQRASNDIYTYTRYISKSYNWLRSQMAIFTDGDDIPHTDNIISISEFIDTTLRFVTSSYILDFENIYETDDIFILEEQDAIIADDTFATLITTVQQKTEEFFKPILKSVKKKNTKRKRPNHFNQTVYRKKIDEFANSGYYFDRPVTSKQQVFNAILDRVCELGHAYNTTKIQNITDYYNRDNHGGPSNVKVREYLEQALGLEEGALYIGNPNEHNDLQ